MNIVVLDDHLIITEGIDKMIINSCHDLKISEPNIFNFTTSQDFISWFNEQNIDIDVCFLDLDLNSEINGLDIAKIVKSKNYHTLLVFITSFENYFTKMVQLEPFRFLDKPFNYEEFHKIFVDIYKRIVLKNFEKDCSYRFKNNGITFSINLKDVIYISSYKRKIIMLNTRNEYIDFYGKLDAVEIEVNSLTDKFIRINKSYLFNKDYIDVIGKNSITVQGVVYQISPKYKHNLEIIT